jgi:uncharacterized protein (UPF0332 family)
LKETFLNLAKENILAAELLFDNNMFNASANRAYYAAFHIAIVYLFEKAFEPKIDHKNVLSLFINEFINKKKTFPSKLKQDFYDLQGNRNDADYKSGISKKTALFQLKIAKEFFDTIIMEIKNEY